MNLVDPETFMYVDIFAIHNSYISFLEENYTVLDYKLLNCNTDIKYSFRNSTWDTNEKNLENEKYFCELEKIYSNFEFIVDIVCKQETNSNKTISTKQNIRNNNFYSDFEIKTDKCDIVLSFIDFSGKNSYQSKVNITNLIEIKNCINQHISLLEDNNII